MMAWRRGEAPAEYLNPAEFTNGHFRDRDDGHLVSPANMAVGASFGAYEDGTVEVIRRQLPRQTPQFA